jgi:imidazolonepropionase-like amidohydrolase/Tol biopolymer transport system component
MIRYGRNAVAFFLTLSLATASPMPQQQEQKKEEVKKDPAKEEQEPRPNEEERKRKEEELKKQQPPVDAAGEAAKQKLADQKLEKKDEKPKWDVNAPMSAPSKEVSIDTTEVTWTSIDVSPDGREIVFDLLGDLYVIPMGGGEARALTSGIAWDMQPKYNPDGKRIAFTSDRGAGDNVWTIARDGSDPKQVTKESFRLLNQPDWSPDGEYIVARKHFTSRRSLGAGEMWLYHRSGGEGVQLTKKPNDQKDAGEPAFSPDGRYLYFSQDVSPGPVFEYNKDPNGEIFVIQRLDRESGDVERYVTGPGGSIRPTPSPDGKSLAFVRRIRTKSVLHVLDLESGIERPIHDALDRDMQETWSIHGVYPQMSWTPDSRSLVFWANGKIQRIDVASKQVSDIPFRVRTTRTIQEALRFPIEVAPAKFPVRMLRWAEVSPNGSQVVYQALGHLYVRDLPNGTPRRLTSQNEHFEYFPSYSRDGRQIVFTTWDDEKLGSIRVVSSRGGDARVVSAKPGSYAEPVFSPDGTKIVYRTMTAGDLRPSSWSRDGGIWVMPAGGGSAKRVSKSGFLPQFGRGSDRIYFVASADEGKRAFRSVDLDGSDERTHLISEEAREFRISPDEKWVAFTERFNAYVAPFTLTGKSFDVGAETKAVPVRKVSRDAGEYIHWSGDSKRLHWVLGPELFTRELAQSFDFLEGAPEKLPEPAEKGINIAWEEEYDVPAGTLALTNARIITMRGDEVIDNGTIVIEGNRIAAVGPAAAVAIPANAKRIDASGKTILPGLIDVHWHGSMGDGGIIPEQSWVNYASLAFGVTTLHDPSNDTGEIFAASELAKAGGIVAPRIFSTGTILYGAKAPFRAVVDSLEDARSHLRRMKAVGAFTVKSYNQPRRDQRQQIVQAARELGMMVVPEGGSLVQHNMTMIVDGHTGIEHSIPVAKIYDDVEQLWTASKTWYTPTLVVGYGGLWGENYWYQKTNVWENERLLSFVPRRVVDERSRRRPMVADDDLNHVANARIATELARKGVGVQIGAHGQREGLAAHWEMWSLAQGGMTPMEALRAATLTGAQYIGLDRDLGSLEPGKLADLIVLDRNPLADLRDSESVAMTMVNGRLYDARTMNEIGNREKPRSKFFFETADGNQGWSPSRTIDAHNEH